SQNEIEKMKNDAKEHAAEDKKKRESVDVRNQADSLVFQTKKQLDELKDKVNADDKSRLEAEIRKLEDAIASNNIDQMKTATESLNKSWSEVASKLYSQQGSGGQQSGPQQEQGTSS